MSKSVKNQTEIATSQRTLVAAALQRSIWFSSCRQSTRDAFVDAGRIRHLRKGEALSRCGQLVDHLSFIADGSLEVSTTTRVGKRHVLRYLEPGQIMNLIPVLDEQVAIHDAVAHIDTLILDLHRSTIQHALATEPDFNQAVMRLLCLRSRLTYLDLTQSSLLPLRARCASALLHLAEPYGLERHDGLAISLKLSQDEFADMVGNSRTMVNRELKQMEREGIIRTTYSHFVVLDMQSLREIANG